MAGSYPDVPNARVPYDLDGTQVYRINAHVPTAISPANIQWLNSEFNNNFNGPNNGPSGDLGDSQSDTLNGLLFMFPQAIDVSNLYIASPWGVSTYTIYTSNNTTNGIDGTWTNMLPATAPYGGTVIPDYRNSIFAATATGITALKITNVNGGSTGRFIGIVHIYGHDSVLSGNRLEMWHPTIDQPLYLTPAYFDWGNVPRGSVVAPRSFRIKNLAATLTATTVVVGYQTLTDTTSEFQNAHTLSQDGGTTYAATQTLASIAPATISPVLMLKYAPLTTDAISLWAGKVFTTTGSWV